MTDSLQRAHEAYFRALAVIDPLRLRFWDSRGATTTQLRVMYEIRKGCEPSTGEVAEQLHVRPATLTGLADRLERNGFIRRWTDPTDRRVVRIGLTDEGNAVLDEVFAAAVDYLSPIFERMGEAARDELTRALEGFVETAAAVQGQPAVANEDLSLTTNAT
jgi:DNA-binding MarR family transcriptional regulator